MDNLKALRKSLKMSQQALADELEVSRSTIAMWETDGSEPDHEMLEKLADYFGVSIDYLFDRPANRSNGRVVVSMPVLGHVAAGVPIQAIEDIIGEIDVFEEIVESKEYFALQIQGDSMEPRIKNGDIVIVHKQAEVESGEVAVVLVNGDDATVKKFMRHDDGISLVPFNSAYEPMFYSPREIKDLPVTVLGKVVELRGKF